MEDSPRASKRRRLDNGATQDDAANNTTTPSRAVIGTLKRPLRRSGRHALLEAAAADEELPIHVEESIQTPLRNESPNSERKRRFTRKPAGKDVYDDIDGALGEYGDMQIKKTPKTPGVVSSGRKTRSTRVTKQKKDIYDDIDGAMGERRSVNSSSKRRKSDTEGHVETTPIRGRVPSTIRKVQNGPNDEVEGSELTETIGVGVKLSGRVGPSAGKNVQNLDSPDELGTEPSILLDDEVQKQSHDNTVTTEGTPNTHSSHRRANRTDSINNEDISIPAKTPKPRDKRQRKSAVEESVSIPANGHVDELMEDVRLESGQEVQNGISKKPRDGDDPDAMDVDSLKPTSHKKSNRAQKAAKGRTLNGHASSFTMLQNIVLSKLTQKRPIPLTALEHEYFKVHQLVEQTVVAGEGNSMLVIGARGSGKSALVNKVLLELSQEHRSDFHVVRLNGFIHTDDKLALREIWRQLGKEMDIDEDGIGKNYADTLTTLLALLSHPSDVDGEESDKVARSVIFVMDEFDLFASHPRQTLLYNLFDIAQSRKAPIAVLGLTTRIDVVESLEKRVKSRFSHRYVHLSLAKSFGAHREIFKAALTLEPEELNVEEQKHFTSNEKPLTSSKKMKVTKEGDSTLATWNTSVFELFEQPEFTKSVLALHYHRTKSIPALLTAALLPVLMLSEENAVLKVADFQIHTSSLQPPDSKLYLLPALSDLQLALLISAARLDIILDTDTCNFNMAYAEYVSLASKARIQSAAGGAIASGAGTKVWGKGVARGEWERLMELELLMPVVGSTTGANAMVRVDVALEEIAPSVPGMDRMMDKWCRTI